MNRFTMTNLTITSFELRIVRCKKVVLILSCLFLIITMNAQVTNGLIAEYTFNDATVDDGLGQNNGTAEGGLTFGTDRHGDANRALQLDGIDDRVNLGLATSLKVAIGTVSVWVKRDSVASTNASLSHDGVFCINNGDNSLYEAVAISVRRNNGEGLFIQSSFGQETFVAAPNIGDGNWHHLVLSFDNDSLYTYVDGVHFQTKSRPYSLQYDLTTDNVYIGSSENDNFLSHFAGMIDDFRMYNRLLTAAEVDTLYNEQPISVSTNPQLPKTIFNIFPNPSTDYLIFENAVGMITIYNMLGQPVKQFYNNNERLQVDISGLSKGTFNIVVQNDKVSSRLFIKQ